MRDRSARIVRRALIAVSLAVACGQASGQGTDCPKDPLDASADPSSRTQPCEPRAAQPVVRKSERVGEQRLAERTGDFVPHTDQDPPLQPRVVTPPGAIIIKKPLVPDPVKEERMLRERVHRALRKNDRGKLSGTVSAECETVVQQIAEQQPLLRSLRTETRTQARDRVTALTNEFRDRNC